MKFVKNMKISKLYEPIKKMLKNTSLNMVVIIAIIVAAIVISITYFYFYFYFYLRPATVKEGFDKQMNAYNNVTNIVFSPKPGFSDNWLHIATLEIYDQNGSKIDSFNPISSSTGIYQNNQQWGTSKLFDNNENTMFHSGGENCTLTIPLIYPTRVSRIYIRQRPDGSQHRMRGYKLVMKNGSNVLAEIDLASSSSLFNSPFADTFNFNYPVDPQIAINAAAAKAAVDANAAAAAQAAAAQAKVSADQAKSASSTTVDALAQADALAKTAKISQDTSDKTMKKAEDFAKEADEDAATANLNANKASAYLNSANKVSTEFKKKVDDAISESVDKLKTLSTSLTPQPKSNAMPYNSFETNQL